MMATIAAKLCHWEAATGTRLFTRLRHVRQDPNRDVAITTRTPHHMSFWSRCGKLHQCWPRLYCSSAASTDYLQTTSPIPTMHFQPFIPQLPIPSLEHTCQRYLASQRAFLPADEFAETQALVEEFERGEGFELNQELIRRNKENSHTSYITDAWMDVYLTYRPSVIFNTSPASLKSDDPRPAYMEQTIRATNLTVSLLRFLKTLREDRLVPDAAYKEGADKQEFWNSLRALSPQEAYRHAVSKNVHPLDMSQFHSIFNSTRIPRPDRDQLFKDESKRHVLVLSKGHMYVFDALDSSGSILPGPDIQAHLRYILQHSSSLPSPEHPLGYLTTEHRDTWTWLREKLASECKDNETSLSLIDSSLFCLCLEDDSDTDREQLIRRGLYGNAGNRWFDKSFQLILTKDGRLPVNIEHSWGDGVTLRRVFIETYQDMIDRPAVAPDTAASNVDSSQCVKKLEFKLSPAVCQGVEEAKANHALTTSQLNLECLDYRKYGHSFIKRCRVSPDALVQLALQMAFHRVAGRVAATYESCSTALFKHGRTETIRSATMETKTCTEAFYGKSGVGTKEKRALIKACSDKHRQLSKEASLGQGWDRHLFALRVLASTSGKAMPRVFQDPAYANINTIELSTSTTGANVSSDGAAFAPVSSSGLGVGYIILEDSIQLMCTSYPTSPSLSDFIASVQDVLDELQDVINA